MFYRNVVRGGAIGGRYVRGADGQEYWSQSSSARGPRDEMTARYDGECRLPECGDRKIVGGVTVIAKRNGQWNHKECPVKVTEEIEVVAAQADGELDIADAADRLMDRYEAAIEAQLEETRREHGALGTMSREQLREVWNEQAKRRLNSPNQGRTEEQIASEADALLAEYEAANRKRNLETVQKGIYRVSLHGQEGRYETDHINLQLTPNERYGSVKIGERHGESIGRIDRDGNVRLWEGVEADAPRTKAVLAALDVLLGSADTVEFARSYAVAASECMRCGDSLVDAESRARLLGPTCVKKWRG